MRQWSAAVVHADTYTYANTRRINMKKIVSLVTLAAAAAAAVTLSGCIVAPPRPAYAAPPGVVYVAPTYASPGIGYAWEYHPHYGWGWHHPQYGWHRGWN